MPGRSRRGPPPQGPRLTVSAVIEALRSHAQHTPWRTALRDYAGELSYADLLRHAAALAASLGSRGCRTIGLAADNGADWIVADIAAMLGGFTCIPIPAYFTASQVTHVLEAGGVDSVLVEGPLPAVLSAAGFTERGSAFGRLRLLQRRVSHAVVDSGQRAAKVTFTSGSSGRPKGVRLAADTLDGVATRLRGIFAGLGIERHLCVMPLATLLENVAGVYVPLMLGATVHVPSLAKLGLYGSSRIDAPQFKATIENVRAQSLILQPQLLRELTATVGEHGWDAASLRFVAVGGARTAESDLAAARAVGIPAWQGYGLSECASVVALNRPGDARTGSVGRPLAGVDVSVAPDGEIRVRGQCMLGYLGEGGPPDGEVATGDIGYVDDDGFLFVTGRKKDVFITSFGRNVSPEWPEAELLHEPEIGQVCVFGEARPANTAVIFAAAPAPSDDAIAAAVARANERLPDYARVSKWTFADEPFSVANGLLTATGKPRRPAIAERYQDALTDDSFRRASSIAGAGYTPA